MTAAGWVQRGRTHRAGRAVAVLSLLMASACGGGENPQTTSAGSEQPGGSAGTGAVAKAAPGCPSKPLVFAAPTPRERIGQVPSSGATSPEPIFESRVMVNNPNATDLTVTAKALVETDRPIRDYGAPGGGKTIYSAPMVVTLGLGTPAGGNRLDGKDITIQTASPAPVPAGRSVELIAGASTVVQAAPIATRVTYGRGSLTGSSQAEIDRCEIAIEGAQPMRVLDGSPVRGQAAAAACPDKPVKVMGPTDWKMTNNFSGVQTWEATVKVSNPNASDIVVVSRRSFALAEVTRADGTTYTGYSGPMTFVTPASGGVVLAGQTVEMVTSAKLVRPAKVGTKQAYVDLKTASGDCAVALDGAQPPTAAVRGPHICADGIELDTKPSIDIGVRNIRDEPACA